MSLLKSGVVAALFAGVVGVASPASADYVLTPYKSGTTESSLSVAPGGTFAVDFVLTSNASDRNASATFRPIFSAENLVFNSYEWQAEYASVFAGDKSEPSNAQLPLAITANTLIAEVGDTSIDVEMSNVVLNLQDDLYSFGTGNLVKLNLAVPIGWSGPDSVTLTSVPTNGFTYETGGGGSKVFVPTTAGTPLTINIVPEPGCMAVFGMIGLGLLARRRSRIA